MKLDALVADLKASLKDSATLFTSSGDDDFQRHIQRAAADLSRYHRRNRRVTLELKAEQSEYPAPSDMVRPRWLMWAEIERRKYNPWDCFYPGSRPLLSTTNVSGATTLIIEPAISATDLAIFGSTAQFEYYAQHIVANDGTTTVPESSRDLLLLRAQAEACKELSLRNLGKSVSIRDGLSGGSKNGTPAAMYDQLMSQFKEAAVNGYTI